MNDKDNDSKILCDIAHCTFKVVNQLLSRDQLLARELRSSTTGSRQIYREECITVEIAATLREQFPAHVDITLFTSPEESRNGADWYWRFERGDQAIHALVQAKRVQRTEFGQRDDDGRVDIDIQQLEHLIQATKKAGSFLGLEAWLATYARFDATPPCGKSDLQHCYLHQHQATCAESGPSLWIAPANEIVSLNRTTMAVRTIVEHSIRLDCLLPCIDGAHSNYGPANKGFALQSSLKTYDDCLAIILSDPLLNKQLMGAMRIVV